MKRFLYILICLSLLSCASRKNLGTDVIYDEDALKVQQALQQEKAAFLRYDSAMSIISDLGWAERIISEAKVPDHGVPSVFRLVDGTSSIFTVQSPCMEMDTEKYFSIAVFAEHTQLDSALIKAKMQGVDDIYKLYRKQADDYEEYVRNAKYSCLCIMKDKKKYIVNATVCVPNKDYISPEESLRRHILEFLEEEKQNQDTIYTEKAETPSK